MPIAKKQMLRILRLVELLKSDRYPNCSSFARMMHQADIDENLNITCTAKTIFRDIQTLKNDFNAPIKFDTVRNGYYLTDLSWNFPGGNWEVPEISANCFDDSILHDVIIRCDPVLSRYVRRYPLHQKQFLIPAGKFNCDLHIDKILQSRLIPWIMHFCPRATVIAPASLRRKIFDISSMLMEKHCDL